ncbi:MAG: ATP synthase F1 subunit delta [Deltaproteobacteria bacterium CG_4_8_14_3_um_filter_51_11]|nr:MAG: ATP synthase F1 subunit delta [Deltaproteobacteria bacterium CG23_combo_of_CG06-09_8_20_14_all_51_20]PIX18090.1 MAG: ATP synthase F1 subunit delta [Deltaproteobacteria bacterium CG_4_8_14_3_um_filter_51_11]PIY24940.1 MAG: ATP synthase F1 subunit delta [Deltaproteobacteria bacterium CG_4_10_14_3_um_filter_51_14]PJB33921.1 MAG: ATP synthase F1 subunit delta [Deltaproteobacteria bacterium CG_4_9_14_3_um_filter_51_14]
MHRKGGETTLSGSKVSKRYAKALLSIGQEDNKFKEYGADLQDFASFCAANQELYGTISSKVFAVDDRKKILDYVLGKSSYENVVKNFLRLLLEKDRLGVINEINGHYSQLIDDISGITRAEIIAARPIKSEAMDRLSSALARLTSKNVRAEVREDSSLIGGLVVRIGDLVLDGSVKAQLEGLKESLKRGEYH